jgi:hypothetical protein
MGKRQIKQNEASKPSCLASPAVLKQEMDLWVKDFEKKIKRIEEVDVVVSDNIQNINHNYELIQGLQQQVAEIRREIEKVKHINLIAMKSRPLDEINYN